MWWLLEGIEPSFDACLSPGGRFRRAAEERNGRKNDLLEPRVGAQKRVWWGSARARGLGPLTRELRAGRRRDSGRIIFFCYHIGITFRSRYLVVFFQLRSVSCAPFTPAFADGVVQRSLALYLPCFVSLSPWMAESHLTPIIIPSTTNHKIPFLYFHL